MPTLGPEFIPLCCAHVPSTTHTVQLTTRDEMLQAPLSDIGLQNLTARQQQSLCARDGQCVRHHADSGCCTTSRTYARTTSWGRSPVENSLNATSVFACARRARAFPPSTYV